MYRKLSVKFLKSIDDGHCDKMNNSNRGELFIQAINDQSVTDICGIFYFSILERLDSDNSGKRERGREGERELIMRILVE